MREGLVRFSHAVYIFFLLDGGAFTVGGVEQFVGELVFHSLFGAAAAIRQQPADGERGATVGIHFDRNLIVRATDAAGLDFEQRLGILDGLLEQLDSLVAALFLHLLHGVVEDALGGGLLAAPHHRVHELGDQGGVVDGISCYFTLRYVAFSRHYFFCSGAKPQTFFTPSGAWLRTWSATACGWRRRWCRACRAQRDNGHPAGLSRGRRG